MADDLRTRVGRIIAGSAHALLDKIEDQAPESVMQQAIRDVDKIADEVRQELGRTAANRHLAQQQHAELNRRHAELSSHIEEALTQQREDLARPAIARQIDIEAQLPVLDSTLATLAQEEGELKSYVEALQGKKRDMEDALEAYRASRAQVQKPVAGSAGSSQVNARVDAATGAFGRVFQRQTGLSAAAQSARLEQAAKLKELEELVRSNKVEERLAQFKTRQL